MPTSTVKEVSGPPETLKTLSHRPIFAVIFALVFAVCGTDAHAQHQAITADITVVSVSPARVRIKVELRPEVRALSFRNAHAGVLGLAEKIENLEARDANGAVVPIRKSAGEFQSDEKFSRVSYEVNLAATMAPSQKSHVSWLTVDRGLLMLGDLLPVFAGKTSAQVRLSAPRNWSVHSNLSRQREEFLTDDASNGIFLIGTSITQKKQNELSLVRASKWPFSDDEAMKVARAILVEHSKVTGFELPNQAVVMLLPYPGDVGSETWSAETRGNTVVLLLGNKGSRKRVLTKLGIVLSHELFHLWIPNSLTLEGDYDWFFEGFTLYQALRTDLRLGLITFDDFMKTIADVYDAYRRKAELDNLSLLEASERRWTHSPALVYEKGMLVAFIYDLTLRQLSDCSSSLDDVYRSLFQAPLTGQRNANRTIIDLLTKRPELKNFARDFIEVTATIQLDEIIEPFGLELELGMASRLRIKDGANEPQRKLQACIKES